MKNGKPTVLLILFLLTILLSPARAQSSVISDDVLIKQAALNYIEGYYSGDVERIEKAIHPDFNKASPRDLPNTGRTLLAYTTYSALMENARAKIGALDDTARHIQVKILNVDNDVSNVKVTSANYTEYLQLVKLDGQWKILNILFTTGTNGPSRIKDFNTENEKPAIQKTALQYLNGLGGSDAAHLELSISPDFNKVTLVPVPTTGKVSLRKVHYEAAMQTALSGIGKQDEIYRDYHVSIIDLTDGLAVAKCELATTYEYVQMFKSNGSWKVLNSINKVNSTIPPIRFMTVTAGDRMPDFTLPVYGGGEFTLSKNQGKSIMLVFPRGWIGNQWCPYCPYQYLELEHMQKTADIEKKYGVKILFVMPYSSDRVKDWLEKFPAAMQTVENIKNPTQQPAKGSIQEYYVNWARNSFPLQFEVRENDSHNVIP
ncbi:MAG: nuclear transport factor 2 family protein, partial [Bacteroidota bacterium]|nr:nuclear transport factor 2 family protein [Bacteroidota bacterium]